MTIFILCITVQLNHYERKMSSAFESVEKLLHNHEYTIKISVYDTNIDCNHVKTFKGRYIGWKLKGLERMFIPDHIRRLWLLSALSEDVTLEAKVLVHEALDLDIIGLETICLVFDNIHMVSTFDPKTQKFTEQLDKIKPFKVSKTETRCGTETYETYVNLNYILGAGSITDTDVVKNDYLEVELVKSDVQ